MKTIDIRRSVRKYSEKPVGRETLEKLLRAGMQAPSAGNQQPWEFIVVTDRSELEKLSGLSPYSGMVKSAAAAIIPLINEEGLKFADFASQDLAACTENILLEAAELGLGTVWLGVTPLKEREVFVRKQFDLGERITPFSVISLGYPAKADANRFVDRWEPNRVRWI